MSAVSVGMSSGVSVCYNTQTIINEGQHNNHTSKAINDKHHLQLSLLLSLIFIWIIYHIFINSFRHLNLKIIIMNDNHNNNNDNPFIIIIMIQN